MILCGWCLKPTADVARCGQCGHPGPRIPWDQRATEVPIIRAEAAGRPALDVKGIRQKLREARTNLGPEATQAALADHLGISARTLGRWQKLAD